MVTPSIDEIKGSTEKAVSFVEWLAEVLRGKNWVTKLLLFDVLLLLVFNPTFFPTILKLFITEPKLPERYTLFLGLVIGLVFMAALIVAIRTKPAKATTPAVDFAKRSAIKGLRPFGFEDAELFPRLQRERDLHECLEVITDRDFRFGILCGESGCGKSSFLQAGLWPRLQQQKTPYCCIYVKFSDLDSVDSLRQALTEQVQLRKEKIDKADFLTLLETVVQMKSEIIVLLFDQFEQFFVHHKLKEEREPFVQALAAWYHRTPPLPIKILVCIRDDFSGRLCELQKVMGYSLGPRQNLRLEKFTPEQAAAVFRVIAETEGIDFDQSFVREITEKELASREDGLISPVDIQILAWMIAGQKTTVERAFNRVVYQKLGGVEGLLERFLLRALQARETEARRQATIKVMLSLTDLERNARAGLLTANDLQQRIAGTVAESELKESLEWLVRSDVRLITPSQRNGILGYELAHERLIPALRRLAGKTISLTDQANQLLDRRVNEWLGNNRSRRYLLSWSEWRLIRRQTPYLVWGPPKDQKEALLTRSKQRWQLRVGVVSLLLLLLTSFLGWLNTPWGQIWQVKQNLSKLSKRIHDAEALTQLAVAYTKNGNLKQVLQVAEGITDTDDRARALGQIAERAAQIGDAKQASALLTQAQKVAEGITYSFYKVGALGQIAENAAKIIDAKQADALLAQALQVAEGLADSYSKASALGQIAEHAAKIAEAKQDTALLSQAHQVAEKITPPDAKARALSQIAERAAKIGDVKQASALLAQALRVTEGLTDSYSKASALSQIAKRAAKIGDAKQASTLLAQALQGVEGIIYPDHKAIALGQIAESAAQIADTKQVSVFLAQTLRVAKGITPPYQKALALSQIAESVAKTAKDKQDIVLLLQALQVAELITPDAKARALGQIVESVAQIAEAKQNTELLSQALQVAERIIYADYKAIALRQIAESAAKIAEARQNTALLPQALQVAEGITYPDRKVIALCQIAESGAKIGDAKQASALLVQTLQVAEGITETYYDKARALRQIAKSAAKLENWRLALRAAELIGNDVDKTKALAAIVQAWAERKNPILSKESKE